MDNKPTFTYKYDPTPTIHAAHQFLYENWVVHKRPTVVGILGPPNSGKTVGVVQMFDMIYTHANVAEDGNRYVRIGVLRRTIAELRKTVLKTIKEWFPSTFGTWVGDSDGSNTPFSGSFKIPHISGDGSFCFVEIIGVAYDGATDEDAIAALRSHEFTALYLNEVPTMRANVIMAALQRSGRYPSNALGAPLPKLVIMDYNMPYAGSWAMDIVEQNGEKLDEDGEIAYVQKVFIQPPAAKRTEIFGDKTDTSKVTDYTYNYNPEAEIPKIFSRKYYVPEILRAKGQGDYDYLDRELCMLPITDTTHKPVYGRSFNREKHIVNSAKWDAHPSRFTVVGFDTSGLHLAAQFVQLVTDDMGHPMGWVLTNELYGGHGAVNFRDFADTIQSLTTVKHGRGLYDPNNMVFVCDPNNARNQETGLSPLEILTSAPYGFNAVLAPTNSPELRIRSLSTLLEASTGVKRLSIRAHCQTSIKGLEDGHVFARLGKTLGFKDKPRKDTIYSHYMDALEYASLYINTIHEQTSVLAELHGLPTEPLRVQ